MKVKQKLYLKKNLTYKIKFFCKLFTKSKSKISINNYKMLDIRNLWIIIVVTTFSQVFFKNVAELSTLTWI